jgi:hypothetical protein
VRRPGGRVARHPPVAVGGPPRGDLSGAGSEQLATSVSFGDLGLLVLSDDALDLGEQHGLRIVGGQVGGVGEPDGDADPGQLVEDQHLVGVGAGQPVRREAPHLLEQAALGGVPESVEAGPVQSSTGMTVVDVLADKLVAGAGHVAAQQFQLRADRAAFGLPLGRHARIQRHPHGSTPARTEPAARVVAASRRNW